MKWPGKMMYSCVVAAMLMASNAAFAQSFYAVLVGDTNDPSIGVSCGKDLNEMSATMRNVAKKIGYQYQEIVCREEQFGRNGVHSAILKLSAKPEDIIFFYYTGHGVNNPDTPTPYPILNLKGQNLELETVHRLLKKKSPKFCLTLADCCNHLPANTTGLRPLTSVHRGITVTSDTEMLQHLFARANGDLLVSSASKGEMATAHPDGGSYYSNTWLQALANAGSRKNGVSWDEVLTDAENRLQQNLETLPDSVKHHSQWTGSFETGH